MARLHNAAIEKHIPLYRRMQSATQNGPGRDLKRFVESTTGGSNLRVMLSRELYAPPDFEKKLDTSNLDIFPCDNGVFVTEAGAGASRRPSFRPIHSTDYLTKTSGWAYDPLQAREKRAAASTALRIALLFSEHCCNVSNTGDIHEFLTVLREMDPRIAAGVWYLALLDGSIQMPSQTPSVPEPELVEIQLAIYMLSCWIKDA